jgi:glycosyltransferase involved in cell wall biosynthesis
MTVKRVLFVCSGNHSRLPVFILDQKKELEKRGFYVDMFVIEGKGMTGYLGNWRALRKKIVSGNFQLVHAHFGLSGLLACLQRTTPVVITYHGCDLNNRKHRSFSRIAHRLSSRGIVVSERLLAYLDDKARCSVIPCGVDMDVFQPMDRSVARNALAKAKGSRFDENKKYILFSSTFDRPVKNPSLAIEAVKSLGKDFELIEFRDYHDKDVVFLFNACDVLLLTSHTEGSPQVVKEAMACNRPVVTTDVGDVRTIIKETAGCFISAPEKTEIANNIIMALQFKHTNGRDVIGDSYNNEVLITRVIDVYNSIDE